MANSNPFQKRPTLLIVYEIIPSYLVKYVTEFLKKLVEAEICCLLQREWFW